jgi:hypothetical protein
VHSEHDDVPAADRADDLTTHERLRVAEGERQRGLHGAARPQLECEQGRMTAGSRMLLHGGYAPDDEVELLKYLSRFHLGTLVEREHEQCDEPGPDQDQAEEGGERGQPEESGREDPQRQREADEVAARADDSSQAPQQ